LSVPSQKRERSSTRVLKLVIVSVPDTITNYNTLVHDLSLFWLGIDKITTSNTLVHDLSLFWLGTDNIYTSNTLVHTRVLEVDMLSVAREKSVRSCRRV
jgi:hypothetical protein